MNLPFSNTLILFYFFCMSRDLDTFILCVDSRELCFKFPTHVSGAPSPHGITPRGIAPPEIRCIVNVMINIYFVFFFPQQSKMTSRTWELLGVINNFPGHQRKIIFVLNVFFLPSARDYITHTG